MIDTSELNEAGHEDMTKYHKIMDDATKMASDLMPSGRYKSLFITELEKAVFFGKSLLQANLRMTQKVFDIEYNIR